MSDWRVPLSDLAYGPEEGEAALRVIGSRWLSMGPEVAAFEEEFAQATGARHALAVANGTAALHLSLLAVGVGPGDEVIQPAVNFVAAANMTLALGARPVFADIVGPDDPTIAPEHVRSLVSPRTRAVIAMHYAGYLCHMDDLARVCEENGLALIEDAPHALGARYVDPGGRSPHGAHAGTIGDVGCFSFFSNKNLAVGEGGMVVADRDEVADRIRALRSHGMTTLTWDRHRGRADAYDVITPGFNYRLDELRAAIGRVQLGRLPEGNLRRAARARAYRGGLAGASGVAVPFGRYSGESAHHIMPVLADDPAVRRAIVTRLAAERIQTSRHYPCVADFTAFGALDAGALPYSRDYAERTFTLPLFPDLDLRDVEIICAFVREEGQAARSRS